MKYCFEEKKRMVSIAATVMFVCIAGVIYVVSGRADNVDGGMNISQNSDESRSIVSDNDEHIDNPDEDNVYGDSVTEKPAGTKVNGQEIVVHICGAVRNPGVYEFGEEVRLADVIDKAGGFNDNAAKDYLNLAKHVTDGEKIIVYTKKEVNNNKFEKNVQENTESQRSNNVVNINSATREELMNIPGIGESKADDIIEYRSKNGGFKKKEEIMNIPGIKEGIYNKISDDITI